MEGKELTLSLDGGCLCTKCNDILGPSCQDEPDSSAPATIAAPTTRTCCCVCLGLWEPCSTSAMQRAIDKACEPYGGMEANRFSLEQPPSAVIPGDVALRYRLAALTRSSAAPLSIFLRNLKAHLKTTTLDFVKSSQQATALDDYPSCVESEEQGFLCVHVVVIPNSNVQRPSRFAVRRNKRRNRKRFRGRDPTEKQGGDPRQNWEHRICSQGIEMWSCNDVEAALTDSPESYDCLEEWFLAQGGVAASPAIEYRVAAWRRPFFLRGLYSKAARDVSQTPFYVPSEENASVMKRMGVTSVEEQINPILAKLAGGMSSLNKDPDGGDTVYSMIKFHASGREDLDVRMLLPPQQTENVGGRPFVCQVIDSFRMPTMEQIKRAPRIINCMDTEKIAVDENDGLTRRRYGRNPLGVDISDCFSFVSSHAFKNLQGETEEKVKYYGCLCWCEREISSQDELETRLGSYPLQIKQKTPIRVLHRRSNIIRVRRVLTLSAELIDPHHFRLNLSTDAGTYVKEFAHGDLGRTSPSLASLLGSKTDLLELDCEGIAGV